MKKTFSCFLSLIVLLISCSCSHQLFNNESSTFSTNSSFFETDSSSESDVSEFHSNISGFHDDRCVISPPTVNCEVFDYQYSFYYGDTIIWHQEYIERRIRSHIIESESCTALCLVKLEEVVEDTEDELDKPFLSVSILEVLEQSPLCDLRKEVTLKGKGNFSIIKNDHSKPTEMRCSEASIVMNCVGSYYIAYISFFGDETVDAKDRIYDIQAWSLPINSETIYDSKYYDHLCDIMHVRHDVRFRSEYLIEKYCRFSQ